MSDGPEDGRSAGFAEDLEAAAQAGISMETFELLASTQFDPGQFAEFMTLDAPLRAFVMRVLGGLDDPSDWAWFNERPDAAAVALWMFGLPGFSRPLDGPGD
ncbi:hypothetical protein BH10ACT3_BH10ACT3_18520 [soil metagenome]